jgi:hypothetical protein
MYLELDKEKIKLILTHTGFTDKDKQEFNSHSEGRSWFVTGTPKLRN